MRPIKQRPVRSVCGSFGFGLGRLSCKRRACVGARAECKELHFEGFSDAFCPDAGGSAGCMLDEKYKAKPPYLAVQAALK